MTNLRLNQLIISSAFLAAYCLLIISTVLRFRVADGDVDYFLLARGAIYSLILLAWLLEVVPNPKRYLWVMLLMVLLAPYLLTHGYMIAVDTSMVFVTASGLNVEGKTSRRFFLRAAYISALIVLCVAILAVLGLLPSAQFEWGGRFKDSVGFLNPNTFYYYLFSSAFIMFVVEDLLGFILMGLIMAAFYPLAESRTFFFAYMLLLFYWVLRRILNGKIRNILIWIGIALAIFFGMLSGLYPFETSGVLAIAFGFDPSEVLSNRLEIIDAGSDASLFSLLGGNANYADSFYVYLMSGVGLPLSFVAILAVLRLLVRKSNSRSDGKLLMAALVYFTIGCFEVPYGGSSLIAVFFAWVVFFSKDGARYDADAGRIENPITADSRLTD